MKTYFLILVLSLACICHTLPRVKDDPSIENNAASITSQIITMNLFKDKIDSESNQVFSPLGVSSLLAILAEGAKGKTYDEFKSVLSFPNDRQKLRESFKEVISSLYSKSLSRNPSFRTWFYIYENNTARDEYKKILEDYYYVDVKDIDTEFEEMESSTPISVTSTMSNSKDIFEFEDLKKSKPLEKSLNEPEEQKDASKFDKVVEDKQYVEVPVIKEEISKEIKAESKKKDSAIPIEEDDVQSVQSTDEGFQDFKVEDNETIKEEEKIDAFRKNIETMQPPLSGDVKDSEGPEKLTIPMKKLEDPEIMQALKTHIIKKQYNEARSLASSITANSISGRDNPSKTKMLLFNGLYYRGNWAYPFQELRSGDNALFYVNKEKSVPVTMMRTKGYYRMADIEELQSHVIELPYEDKRYAFYVMVPHKKDGLKNLIENLNPEFYDIIDKKLEDTFVGLNLPKFCGEETSRAENLLKRLGLNTVFTSNSDLSGISIDGDLFVDGVAQHVNVKVDEGAMSENVLTAASHLRSSSDGLDNDDILHVNRPFLYFVVDRYTKFIIIAGKIVEPIVDDNSLP